MRVRRAEDEELVERVARHAGIVLVGHQSRLVPAREASTFVGACGRLAIAIVGIEGFVLENDWITPQPHIADLSLLDDAVAATTEADAFVREASLDCNAFVFSLAEPGR